jgi:hypothetical protein
MVTGGDVRERVLIAYGEVMSVVQFWEQALALLWWGTTRKKRPAGDFDTTRSQREIMRLETAFLRMPAQAVREAIAPRLDPQAAADLVELVPVRNRLAHRFLREQVDETGAFRPGTHEQLLVAGDRFLRSTDSIVRALASAEPYDGPVPAHWPGVAARVTQRLFSGEPIPRDPREQ